MEEKDYNVDEDVGDFTDEGNYDPEELEDLERIVEVRTPVMIEVDTTKQFLTDVEFENAEMVVEYAKKCGRKHGVVVVVKRSDINDKKRTPRIMLGCERSGGYRGKGTKRRSSTKKCGCPFNLKARVTDTLRGRWGLIVLNGKHNHALVKAFEGHSYMGRLTREEMETVETLSKTGVTTRDILNQLKIKDPTNETTLKTIYNVRSAMRIKETADKSHMQQLFKLLIENGYVVRHRSEASTEVIKDLFFSSTTSIQLARAFPFVFMLDCSYKTNKYHLPLLQIVGVTSTMKTFCVAFCYMNSGKEENYQWALGCFRDLFDTVLAGVFISDLELALMNALKTVFPTAKNLLCRVHITKNVLTNCIGVFHVKAEFDEFMAAFAGVMHSSTTAEYDENVSKMHQRFAEFPVALEYVEDSWLRKYKTYFVAAYVDQFLHLGNTTTNRVEGIYSKLKKYLSTSVGGFVQSFTHIHLLLEGQVIDIRASFEESLTRVPIRFRSFMFKELANVVSTTALEKIETELKTLPSEGVNTDSCTHRVVLSLGLPCAHMLAQYKDEGRSIPLKDVHNFWKKLCITPFTEAPKDEVTIDMEIDMLRSTFSAATIPQKLEIKRQLQCIGQASSTSMLEPKQMVNVRGGKKDQRNFKGSHADEKSTKREASAFEHAVENHAFEEVVHAQSSQVSTQSVRNDPLPQKAQRPKHKSLPKLKVHRTRGVNTSNWVRQFPPFFQPYISNIVDVPGDGHCGFRVVASFYGWDSDGWKIVRRDLAAELSNYGDLYNKVLNPLSSTAELLSSVDCYNYMVDSKNWMIMPYMGNVIATCYNIVVLLISREQCLSFFPLRNQVPADYNQRMLVFGYINGSHFVRMKLLPNSPIPPVSKMWSDHRYEEAIGWAEVFSSRIEDFMKLTSVSHSNTAIIEVLD